MRTIGGGGAGGPLGRRLVLPCSVGGFRLSQVRRDQASPSVIAVAREYVGSGFYMAGKKNQN